MIVFWSVLILLVMMPNYMFRFWVLVVMENMYKTRKSVTHWFIPIDVPHKDLQKNLRLTLKKWLHDLEKMGHRDSFEKSYLL